MHMSQFSQSRNESKEKLEPVVVKTLQEIKNEKKENNWKSERKEVFPIQKLEILQNFNVCDQDTFRSQLDGLIDQKTDRYYGHENSTFKYIENTMNFRHKLDKIDELIQNQLFKGTYESIQPQYIYKKDDIFDSNSKRKKLFNVQDNMSFNLKHTDILTDHRGYIITKTGSKFFSIKELLDRDKLRQTPRPDSNMEKDESQIQQLNQTDKSIKRISLLKNEVLDTQVGNIQQQQLTQIRERSFSKKHKHDARNSSVSKLMLKKEDSMQQQQVGNRSFISQAQQNQKFKLDLMSDVSQWFKNKITKEQKKAGFLEKFSEFKSKIEKQLDEDDDNSENNSEKSYQMDDELIQQNMKSTAYFDKNQKLTFEKQNAKETKKIMKLLLGDEISIKQAMRENDTISKGIGQIQDKLNYLQEIQQANDALKSIKTLMEGKNIKRLQNLNIDPFQLDEASQQMYQEIQKMQEQMIENIQNEEDQDIPSGSGGIQDAVRYFKFIPDFQDTIIFNNNNLDDDNFAIILEAFVSIKGLKALYTIQNSDLQELCLNGCKLSSAVIGDLLGNLKQSCQLKVLGLSQQQFDLHASLNLVQLIKNTQQLLKSCASKHSLEYFNLSFNPVKESLKTDFANAIKSFILQSLSLTHFNLSACGLQGQNALIVFSSLRKAKTLQSLHFSGNELDVKTANQIREMLKSRYLKLNEGNEGLYTNAEKDYNQLPNINNQDSNAKYQLSKEERQKKYDQQNKPSTDVHYEEKNIPNKDQYIFSRILGHLEIQNAHKWVERDECWICNKWQYVLIIWSEGVSDLLYEHKPAKYLQQHENLIKKSNPLVENIYENTKLNPILFGHATNFYHKKFLSIDDFRERLEINLKPYQRIVAKEEEKSRIDKLTQERFHKAKVMLSMMRNLSTKMPLKSANQKKESNNKLQNLQMNQQDLKSIFLINKQWPKTFKQAYDDLDHQQLILIDDVIKSKLKPDELYFAYAQYYPPCQAQFITQSYHKRQYIFVKNFEIKHRLTDIKLSYKKIKKYRINRNFSLKQSVFSQWAVDIQQEYRKAFEADMKYSKIKKFIKDPTEFRDVCQTLLNNYAGIFEVYVYCSGRSNYPSVQWIDFTDFCASWKIIDRNLTLAKIDMLFVAVNYEGVPGGLDDNPDKELCRYEFFEILVRMALAKQELIWTLEVDDLFKANMNSIKKLFQSVLTGLKRVFTLEDAIEMVLKASGLQMNIKDARVAHAYSKFLVVDEMENIDSLQLLNFGEFQEFIARLGQIKYGDPTMTLYDKIFKVLTELLRLIGTSPQHPKNDDLGQSESDYDEDPENLE
ncbi:UNKNOWN [Stylonychia lemnae]|uniref:Leucine rich repeat family protein n=1 Tax=Stylonychia lemnae TaxID=5949 RepID=A0A077ZP08_STYLE|nr:UNKNOWN [Stylonychia lemnae]|eukprot:CDW71199.1 UNKNOWN [Stylonychia lemnae]